MTSTLTDQAPLLDGAKRGFVLGFMLAVMAIMTVDGLLTWVAADEGSKTIDNVIAAAPERFPTGIDDAGTLLNDNDRAFVAARTDGDRLDRDLVTTKTWLAVVAVIAAVALTIASGPGSSRNVLAAVIVLSAAAFFVPLYLHEATIDQVTTAHLG